jgi:hypothetical protein
VTGNKRESLHPQFFVLSNVNKKKKKKKNSEGADLTTQLYFREGK